MANFSLDRRTFTLGAAATAAAALISPAEALQQAGAASKPADTPEQKVKAAMAKLSPAAQAEVEARVANIFRKYGSRLSEEQKTDIRRVMAENQEGLEKMRAFPLDNGDQPATVLHLDGQGEKK
jgi:hypothetical protein